MNLKCLRWFATAHRCSTANVDDGSGLDIIGSATETKLFLDRRINEVLLFGKTSRKLKESISSLQFTEKILDLIKNLRTIKT